MDNEIKGICETCIYLFDESSVTCCIKNGRWKPVKVNNKCDIDSWDGFDLE